MAEKDTDGFKYTVKLSYERIKDGKVTKGTRTLNPAGQTYTREYLSLNEGTAQMNAVVNSMIQAFQPLTTDTITGYSVVQEYADGTVTVTATPGQETWEGIDDVRLINTYSDGDKSYTERISQAATNADEDALKEFASIQARAIGDYNAIEGYYIGSTVESAWKND